MYVLRLQHEGGLGSRNMMSPVAALCEGLLNFRRTDCAGQDGGDDRADAGAPAARTVARRRRGGSGAARSGREIFRAVLQVQVLVWKNHRFELFGAVTQMLSVICDIQGRHRWQQLILSLTVIG